LHALKEKTIKRDREPRWEKAPPLLETSTEGKDGSLNDKREKTGTRSPTFNLPLGGAK